jgi:hypothetical protein
MPRIETIERTIYTFSELSESQKDQAFDKWRESNDYPWHSENQESLYGFANRFNISIRDYSVGTCSHSYVKIGKDHISDDVLELSGVRLATWLWNNHQAVFLQREYITSFAMSVDDYNNKKRWNPYWSNSEKKSGKDGEYYWITKSKKITLQRPDCPFTGYHMDEALLQPLHDFMDKPDSRTYAELLQDCVDNWVKDVVQDMEYSDSREAFDQVADECEFYEDGEMV